MASNISKANVASVLRRTYAAQAAVKHSEGHGALPRKLQQTKLPNGMVIAALENLTPVSRVGVFVRAGPRFEKPSQLGLTHALRNAAGLATKSASNFAITRNIELRGGSLTASTNREDLAYVLTDNRDSIGKNIRFLAETVINPIFRHWELNDNKYRIKVDLARLDADPNAVLIEALHKAAFRSGLSNSLYSPPHRVGKYGGECLTSFISEHFYSNRTAIIGIGVELEALVSAVENLFEMNTSSPAPIAPSKFVGGEVRIETGSPITLAAIVGEGAAAKNQKEVLALALVQQLLGSGSRIKYSNSGALGNAAAKASQSPASASAVNINYSDTGLFGIAVAASPDDVGNVIKASIGQLRSVSKVNDATLQTAKTLLKATLLMSQESGAELLDQLGSQALNSQQVFTAEQTIAAIDSVTAQDVATAVGRALKGKIAIASVGQVHNVPSLDELTN